MTMWRVTVPALLIAGAFLVSVACSSFGATDAGSDASTEDADPKKPPVGEAGTDAATTTDCTPMGIGCTTATKICDPFEKTLSGWDPETAGGGVITLVPGGRTCGESLRARLPGQTGRATAQLRKRLNPATRRGKVTAWIRIDRWTGSDASDVLGVYFLPGPASGNHSVALQIAAEGFKLYAQTSAGSGGPERIKVNDNAWVKFTLVFDRDVGSAAVLVDDQPTSPPLELDSLSFLNERSGSQGIELRVGLDLSGVSEESALRYDDVVLDLE